MNSWHGGKNKIKERKYHVVISSDSSYAETTYHSLSQCP